MEEPKKSEEMVTCLEQKLRESDEKLFKSLVIEYGATIPFGGTKYYEALMKIEDI